MSPDAPVGKDRVAHETHLDLKSKPPSGHPVTDTPIISCSIS